MIGNKNKGFTLFYALLVSSLALAIGASIFDITVREIDLSNAATQSQYAVYVADSGAECALYWDTNYTAGAKGCNQRNVSGTCTAGTVFATSSAYTGAPSGSAVCAGADVAGPAITALTWPVSTTATAATTTFIIMGTPTPKNATPCALVYIAKVGNPSVTTITSHGYNTCVSGPLQLERVFQVTY